MIKTISAALLKVLNKCDLEDYNKTFNGNYTEEEIPSLQSSEWDEIKDILSTASQRALLATYLFIYLHLSEEKKNFDEKSKVVLKGLGLTAHFRNLVTSALARSRFSLSHPNGLLSFIINAPEEVREWVSSIVKHIQHDGLYVEKKCIKSLSPREYEHSDDRKMLDALRSTKGFDVVVKKLNEWGYEPYVRVEQTGNSLKVTKSNFPEVSQILEKACSVLNISRIPDLYLCQGMIGAKTYGVNDPFIVISSMSLGLLSYDELLFIIGHELGHIKSEHMLYHNMVQALPYIGGVAGKLTLGVADAFISGLSLPLLAWQRVSELTADRAGLLCCQNYDAAIKVFIKCSGMPPKDYARINTKHFIDQVKEFKGFDTLDKYKAAKYFNIINKDHPWTVFRAAELTKWKDSRDYDLVLARNSKVNDNVYYSGESLFCTVCGFRLKGDESFCPSCGTPLRTINQTASTAT